MTALLVTSLSCAMTATWIYLLVARGGFWLASQRDAAPIAQAQPQARSPDAPAPGTLSPTAAAAWPHVGVVIPARDEASVIGRSLGSLLEQDYPGELTIVVVDDHSSDATLAIAATIAVSQTSTGRAFDRTATVLPAPDLSEGWSGKLWAAATGVRHLSSLPHPPDYVLLTDADICHAPDTLSWLVGHATRTQCVLTSLMAKLRCESLAEQAFVPAFVFFFQMLYPFAWVNRRDRSTAAAAGGCVLIHRQTLATAGGIEQIRGALIDDCALARLLKPHGPIWIGLTERAISIRPYRSLRDVAQMVTRSAYAELRFSPWRLAGAIAGMAVTYLHLPRWRFSAAAPRSSWEHWHGAPWPSPTRPCCAFTVCRSRGASPCPRLRPHMSYLH